MARTCKALCLLFILAVVVVAIASFALSRSRPTPVIPVQSDSSRHDVAEATESVLLPSIGPGNREKRSEEAYVTLMYNGFFPAIRVLGQSLRESGTTRDYVVLCMDDVEKWARDILTRDGWIVRSVGHLPNSCVGSAVFSRHFIKVQAWLLTEYRRLISIDADAIVLHNIDHLFNSAEFCASYRHSDLFNTGVVVMKPSVETFRDICRRIQSIGSYTGGDQGFLNYYYKELKYAPMFRGNETRPNGKFLRLPAEYNGDIAVFYSNSKWMYTDVVEPYVLHYTLGPVKPWKWWSYPLFSLNWKWNALRERLPGPRVSEPSMWDWQSWWGLALLVGLCLTSRIWCRRYSHAVAPPTMIRWLRYWVPVDGKVSKFLPTLMLLSACYLAYSHVPLLMTPLEAWARYVMWVAFYFILPFSAYCHLAYAMGRQETTTATLLSSRRITIECALWFIFSVCLCFMMFTLPITMSTMGHRVLSFVSVVVLNFVLCHFYGQRVVHLWFVLGSESSSVLCH